MAFPLPSECDDCGRDLSTRERLTAEGRIEMSYGPCPNCS